MRHALLPLIATILLSACTDDEGALGPGFTDSADPANWAYICQPDGVRVVAPGMSFGAECSQCGCIPPGEDRADCNNGVCTAAQCTGFGCAPAAPAGASAGYPACSSSSDCGDNEHCLFDAGCASPAGQCIRNQLIRDFGRAESYCSCRGTTETGSAPLEPYAHAGPC